MFGIFDKITEFIKDILMGVIHSNLQSMFIDINEKVELVRCVFVFNFQNKNLYQNDNKDKMCPSKKV